jgi:hypothetical protein
LILLKQAGLLRSENTILSKQQAITTEAQLHEAARALLAEDAVLRWRWKAWEPKRERRADAVVELSLDGRRFTFDVEFKLSPTARDTDKLAAQPGRRPRLLIAPHLSETLAAHCRERGLNCLDLNGRVWLRAKGLLVERAAGEGAKVRPSQPAPDLFSLKSSRLPRALLSQPGRQWSQKELVERTGLSPGLVSRLTRHLVDEGFLEETLRTLVLKRADALLDAWARQDDWAKRTTVRQYSLLETDPNEVVHKLQSAFPTGFRLLFTQWYAASLRHPYTTPSVVSAYVSEFDDQQVERALNARRVAEGGTLWLIVPKDEGVFRETQIAGGLTVACDAQIYLDLLQVGLRGPDQAKALREWKGFGRPAA